MGGCFSNQAVDYGYYEYDYGNNPRDPGAVDYGYEYNYGNNPTMEAGSGDDNSDSNSNESDSRSNGQESGNNSDNNESDSRSYNPQEPQEEDDSADEAVPEPPNMDSFDWCDRGAFWDIEQQGDDLCWLFTIVDVLEAKYLITHGQRIILSKQELLDNYIPSALHPNRFVATADSVFEWIRINGLSLEKDYGSGRYIGVKEQPKRKNPGCKSLGFSRIITLGSSQENTILELLRDGPGVATINYDETELSRMQTDPTRIYRLVTQGRFMNPLDILHQVSHSVVLTGYDNSESRKAYWVRDFLMKDAPNEGHYRITRHSSVQGNETDALLKVMFPLQVWLDNNENFNGN